MPNKKTTRAKKKTVEKAVKKTPAKKTAKKAAGKAVKKSTTKTGKKAVKKVTEKGGKKSVKKSPAPKPLKKKVVQKAGSKKAAAPKPKTPKSKQVASMAKKEEAADSKSTPIVFSLDDIEELMASKNAESESPKETAKKKPSPQPKKVVVDDEPVEQRVWGAASLADILGFNPAEKKKSTDLSSEEVPKKWKKYYKLLIELRAHVRDELNLHTTDTLKHSSREDSGDLSSYGSHQADAGTDTFDRDFALSLVSSEQDALNEIEEAIQRIKNGSYGACEVTGKAIPAARLTAVPFARFSVEGQAEYEKNMRRKVDRTGSTGLFGDTSDVPKLAANDDDE